jgi:hypothetical protein
VLVLDTTLEPWWLITDWQVETEAEAMRIFCMYRQRWGKAHFSHSSQIKRLLGDFVRFLGEGASMLFTR